MSIRAWSTEEHVILGSEAYSTACLELEARAAGGGFVRHSDSAGIEYRLKKIACRKLWEDGQETKEYVFAPMYGALCAIAGDYLDKPEKFAENVGEIEALSAVNYGLLALRNSRHFHPMVTREWHGHRLRALSRLKAASPAPREDAFVAALFGAAFSDHFLQDSFSAGHMGFNRPRSAASTSLIFHDAWNQRGRIVRAATGPPWRTFGDGFLRVDALWGKISLNPIAPEDRDLLRGIEISKSHVSSAAYLSVAGFLETYVVGSENEDRERQLDQSIPRAMQVPTPDDIYVVSPFHLPLFFGDLTFDSGIPPPGEKKPAIWEIGIKTGVHKSNWAFRMGLAKVSNKHLDGNMDYSALNLGVMRDIPHRLWSRLEISCPGVLVPSTFEREAAASCSGAYVKTFPTLADNWFEFRLGLGSSVGFGGRHRRLHPGFRISFGLGYVIPTFPPAFQHSLSLWESQLVVVRGSTTISDGHAVARELEDLGNGSAVIGPMIPLGEINSPVSLAQGFYAWPFVDGAVGVPAEPFLGGVFGYSKQITSLNLPKFHLFRPVRAHFGTGAGRVLGDPGYLLGNLGISVEGFLTNDGLLSHDVAPLDAIFPISSVKNPGSIAVMNYRCTGQFAWAQVHFQAGPALGFGQSRHGLQLGYRASLGIGFALRAISGRMPWGGPKVQYPYGRLIKA